MRRQIIESHTPRQRITHFPLLGLPRRHTAVVFFCQAGRTPTTLKTRSKILMSNGSLTTVKVMAYMFAAVPVALMILALILLFALVIAMLIDITVACPLVRSDRRGNGKHG